MNIVINYFSNNKKILILILDLLIIGTLLTSCATRDGYDQSTIHEVQPKEIHVIGDYEKFLSNDTVFENIITIPLETNDRCLIESVRKIIIKENLIFIQNRFSNLLVFDINGRFIRQIGKRGKGPQEFHSLYDFDIDKNLVISICDGFEILVFTIDGGFIKKIPLKLKIDGIPFHPEQLIANNDGGYYYWKTFENYGIKEKDQFSMYRVDRNQKIIGQYIPLKRHVFNSPHRFRRYSNYFNIDPNYGVYTIYKASEEGFSPNYYINFGRKELRLPIPEWDNFSDFRERMIEQDYVTHISHFIETDDWVYFRFSYKNYSYHSFFSKIIKKTFIYKPKPEDPPLESLIWKIDGEWMGKMITLIEPSFLIEKLQKMDESKSKNPLSTKNQVLLNELRDLKITDNPVLFICEMKKY